MMICLISAIARSFLCAGLSRCFWLFMLLLSPAAAAAEAPEDAPESSLAEAPVDNATGVIVLNGDTGDVYYEKNADFARPTASMTKLMGIYLVFEALDAGTLARSQAAAIVNRIAALLGIQTRAYPHRFLDAQDHWVDGELGWPFHAGILEDVGNGLFLPDDPLTNEQTIATSLRAFRYIAENQDAV